MIDDMDSPAQSDEEEEAFTELMEPDNPLLERVQIALKKQLLASLERLKLQVREKDEAVVRVYSRREEVGVELYGLQQQLAKLQQRSEVAYARFVKSREDRDNSEAERDEAREKHEDGVLQARLYEEKWENTAKELATLRSEVRIVQMALKEAEKDVITRKKETFATEETMQDLEKSKVDQDLLIDDLTQQIHESSMKISMCQAQLALQEKETESARETLQEAAREIENIRIEKREILTQWKGAIVEIQRRDEALQASMKMVSEEEEAIRNLELEIEGARKEVGAMVAENEALEQKEALLVKHIQSYKEKIEGVLMEAQKIEAKVEKLREDIIQKDKEMEGITEDQKEIDHMLELLDKKYEKVIRARQKTEQLRDEQLSNAATLEHGVEFQLKEVRQIREKTHRIEMSTGKLGNQVARSRLEVLQLSSKLGDLEAQAEEERAKLKKQEGLVEQYEREIKKRDDSVKKNQNYIDRLNRKLEQIMGGRKAAEEEAAALQGPLEAMIASLEKQLAADIATNEELQKAWVKRQTEIVALTEEVEKIKKRVDELKKRETLLVQISVRLEANVVEKKNDIKQIKKEINQFRVEMTKLNRLIAHHRELKTKIEDTIATNEISYTEEIRQLRDDEVNLKEEVKALQQKRDQTQAQILELEREHLLWERKIQIEIETQKALDPSYGMVELKEMKKEVHRMELRLGQLKSKQQELTNEMVRAVGKREVIHLRGIGKNKKQITQNALRKQVEQVKAQIKKAIKEEKKCSAKIAGLVKSLEEAEPLLAEKESELDNLFEQQQSIQAQVDALRGRDAAMGEKLAIITRDCGELEKLLTRGTRKTKSLGRKHLLEQDQIKSKYLKVLEALKESIPQKNAYFEGILSIFMTDEKLGDINERQGELS